MTTDSFTSANPLNSVQAIKLDQVGDFNYMVYASRSLQVVDNSNSKIKDSELEAQLSIYSPKHDAPVYQVNLPFYNAEIQE